MDEINPKMIKNKVKGKGAPESTVKPDDKPDDGAQIMDPKEECVTSQGESSLRDLEKKFWENIGLIYEYFHFSLEVYILSFLGFQTTGRRGETKGRYCKPDIMSWSQADLCRI